MLWLGSCNSLCLGVQILSQDKGLFQEKNVMQNVKEWENKDEVGSYMGITF